MSVLVRYEKESKEIVFTVVGMIERRRKGGLGVDLSEIYITNLT